MKKIHMKNGAKTIETLCGNLVRTSNRNLPLLEKHAQDVTCKSCRRSIRFPGKSTNTKDAYIITSDRNGHSLDGYSNGDTLTKAINAALENLNINVEELNRCLDSGELRIHKVTEMKVELEPQPGFKVINKNDKRK